ncbi:hypothetical protein WBJ53_23690 [Spirosoma sp. SC4-14]|uniref:hypothetical protein n=1 Tax=Spirosoma sp. SC4-14 TaxID=3128900 RepID=UPI0030D2267F
MAKKKKNRARKPLLHAFSALATNATNSVAFHEAVLANSAVVEVIYTLTTTPGLVVSRIAFGFNPVNLKNDQDPANSTIFKTRNRPFDSILCIGDKLMVEVFATGAAGNGWSLDVTVDGQPLPDSPIALNVDPNGVANHAALHNLP